MLFRSAAVKIHDVNPEDTIYTEFGEIGNDNAIHCNLTVYGEQAKDYTFNLKGIAQTEDVLNAIEEKFQPVRAEATLQSPDPFESDHPYNAQREFWNQQRRGHHGKRHRHQ